MSTYRKLLKTTQCCLNIPYCVQFERHVRVYHDVRVSGTLLRVSCAGTEGFTQGLV